MGLHFSRSEAAMRRAENAIPGGVNSYARIGMAPTPLVFSSAKGAYLYDIDGNKLLDYYLGMGPMILGHSPAAVISAVKAQLDMGVLYAGQSEIEFDAARLVCDLVPAAERVRFSSSGTEAVQAALRVARAATGRTKFLKFEGHYHGWADNVLWSNRPGLQEAGPREAPIPIAGSAGQDTVLADSVAILPWNDLALLRERLALGDLAAVIMEPAMCNAGAIAPKPGYLEGALDACRANGTLLIFDETITGFRLAPGGAQQRFGVTPDIATFAKAIANGFAVSAVTGRADVMDLFAHGGVTHGGTYNAQPLAMAATVATLREVSKPGFYDGIEENGQILMEGFRKLLHDAGITATVTGFGSVVHIGFGLKTLPSEWRDLSQMDRPRYSAFCHAMLKRGVRLLERGTAFLSSEHGKAEIEQTLSAAREAVREI